MLTSRSTDYLKGKMMKFILTKSNRILIVFFFCLISAIILWTMNGRVSHEVLQENTSQDNGYSYTLKKNIAWADSIFFQYPADTSKNNRASELRLYENGKLLGPAHSSRSDVSSKGNGRYSHTNGVLFFSSSDGSDPRTNDHTYTATYYGVPKAFLHILRIMFLVLTVAMFMLVTILLRRFIWIRIFGSAVGFLVFSFVLANFMQIFPAYKFDIPTNLIQANSAKGYIVDISVLQYEKHFFELKSDSNDEPKSSTISLFLNGQPFGTPHSNHAKIRETGDGGFSHWGYYLVFSLPKANLAALEDSKISIHYWPKIKPSIAAILLATFIVPLLFLYLSISQALIVLDERYAQKHLDAAPAKNQNIAAQASVFAKFLLKPVSIALIFLTPMAGFYLTATKTSLKRIQNRSIASVVIFEQYLRTENAKSDEIMFFGDSSCLTGVDVDLMNSLSEQKYANYCTLAYLGPKGYSKLLSKIPKTTRPAKLVYMIHPSSFRRETSWNSWNNFIDTIDKDIESRDVFNWKHFTEWVYENGLIHFIFNPMDGPYGIYYGNLESLRESIISGGMFIDPVRGLDGKVNYSTSLIKPPKTSAVSYKQTCPFLKNLGANAEYWDHLQDLKNFLESRNINSLYMVVGEVFEKCKTEDYEQDINTIIQKHRDFMGNIEITFINPSENIPFDLYSTSTHLNIYGREVFSRNLLKTIEKY